MELIEKYGGTEGTPTKGKKATRGEEDGSETNDGDNLKPKGGRQSHGGGTPSRTTLAPPPTANIQRHADGSPKTTHQQHQQEPNLMEPGAEFAPNAEYASPPPPFQQIPPSQYSQQHPSAPESHWYDRIFDVLLGEDETAPKNRIVLICATCRLVNGQAPPGVKSLANVGVWRCMACGATNGETEDEGKRIVREVLGEQEMQHHDVTARAAETSESSSEEAAEPEAKLPRKQRGKGGN